MRDVPHVVCTMRKIEVKYAAVLSLGYLMLN